MAQSLARIIVHIVFGTKNRQSWLTTAVRPKLYAFMAGVLKKIECAPILIGGVDDHVHILCALSKNHAAYRVVEEVKKHSSKWVKSQDGSFATFRWQAGYGVFSVSQSKIQDVRRYIANQEQHHRRMSFQDEYRALLEKHGVEFDERYLWD